MKQLYHSMYNQSHVYHFSVIPKGDIMRKLITLLRYSWTFVSTMTTVRKATPSDDALECVETNPLPPSSRVRDPLLTRWGPLHFLNEGGGNLVAMWSSIKWCIYSFSLCKSLCLNSHSCFQLVFPFLKHYWRGENAIFSLNKLWKWQHGMSQLW